MSKTAEGLVQNPVYGEKRTSRREFGKGAAAMVVSLGLSGVGFGAYKLGERSGGSTPETNPVPAVVGDGEAATEPTSDTSEVAEAVVESTVEEGADAISLVRNPNLLAGHENQDPNNFREIAERSTLELQGEFYISTRRISPEEYPEKFVDLFGAALNLGCTDIEVEPFLALDGDIAMQRAAEEEFLASMDDKYTYPVFCTLFTDMDRTEAEQNPTYELFRDARHGILRRFLRHARQTGNLNEFAAVDMVNHGKLDKRGEDFFGVEINLRVTNDVGGDDPTKEIYEKQGMIEVNVSTKEVRGRYSAILVAHDGYEAIFKDLANLG